MRTELPAERLQRRLTTAPDLRLHAESGAAESGADPHDDRDDDPNSLLPRWLPEAGDGSGLLSRVRADPGRAGAIALAVVAALAVLVTAFTLLHDRPAPVMSAKLPAVEHVSGSSGASPGSSASPAAAAGPDRPVVVSVVGLVHTPGLFTLAPGARVADALQAAGGALAGADTIGLNMARQLADGEQIVVGLAPVAGQPKRFGSSIGAATPSPAPAATSGTRSPGPNPAEVLDLNTATVEQLDSLPGVGPVTAAAIVSWRAANGKFTSVDQLAEVDGIGPARLQKLRSLVRV
ncbi:MULTISPECIES: ComEA family DNA-binding protein [Mycobacterium]|uniref:Membrane protein n=2 Tax=Mycobacterium ulcerans group TaxID=2993898 RepID=A0A9N7LUF7_9MYCO|nr:MULTISPECIES: ComEA family DNA-binding protein [Mycobacterium]AGC63598.1 membrane protein ComEA [Mycobacterium liflandii 128FXT]EPQ46711.1 Putative competence protein [Mycobacterium sp. 012931]MBC9862144.1 Late competence protein ComEA, DNA receptor [Mycobacterium pseudoshottsii]MDC8974481.1 ComEA family DNA-binding protein [Mycobacterium marinum]MDC9006522.1 ComEA family DNA-binding protein [Mycobacterium marinum]